MKLFNSFLVEAEIESDKVTVDTPNERVSDDQVTVFGRFNPPHLGHGATFDKASKLAEELGGADQRFYASHTQDPKKNPLPHMEKVRFAQEMFPQHAHKWDKDQNIKTVLQSAEKAFNNGYKNFHFVGGADRVEPIKNVLRKYNGDLYDFANIYGHSAGDRDEMAEGLEGMSASKLRGFADKDDFESFKQFLPNVKGFDPKEMFEMLQRYQQAEMSEQEVRDLYHTNQLYLVGDIVESLTTGLIGEVHRRGANHLICVTEEGIMFKNFLTDVHSV